VMAVFDCHGVFDFLTLSQKDFLSLKFNQSGARIMPHEISGPLHISNIDAIAILTALQAEKLSKTYIVVYHNCEPDLAVAYLPLENGFPSTPWTCENCQEEIENIDELSFGLMAVSNTSIQFI